MSEFAIGGAHGDAFGHDRPRPYVRVGEAKSRRKAASGRTGGLERNLALVLAVLALAILAGAVFLALPNAFKLSRFEVLGVHSIGAEDVLRAGLVRGNERFFTTDASAIRAALLSEPRIADAKVEKFFPSTLRITVVERKAAVIALADVGGRLRPVAIDTKGVAFGFADEAGASDAPVLSGIRFEGFKAGTRLPENLVATVAALGSIGADSPALLAAFSEIKIVKPAYGEPELLLFPLHHRVRVRTGAVLNESTLRSIILVLEVLGSGALKSGVVDGLEEIDFRTGTVVYRMKGGQAG